MALACTLAVSTEHAYPIAQCTNDASKLTRISEGRYIASGVDLSFSSVCGTVRIGDSDTESIVQIDGCTDIESRQIRRGERFYSGSRI